ncbi:MAG: hypothetical protein JOZ70_06185 [Pseudolabrys sp.]|nr:hypothetical protein [Pseudolabrys sp.]
MLRAYRVHNAQFEQVEGKLARAALHKLHWIDLSDPSLEEKKLVEETFKVDTSPVNEFEPFQISSHFSANKSQITMTALLVSINADNDPRLDKITFIRTPKVLITVSSGSNVGLSELIKECENCFSHKSGRDDIFAVLLDMIVDHTDNILDKLGNDLDIINNRVFQHHATKERRRLIQSSPRLRNRQLERILTDIGPTREALVKLRRSVISFRRMIAFLREQDIPAPLEAKLATFESDLKSIAEAETDLSNTAGFLLEGVIGFIDLLQNKVVNILTLVSLILTPPIVVAGIYGMNFRHMPELEWAFGYPFSLGLMAALTIAMYLWVRMRGL